MKQKDSEHTDMEEAETSRLRPPPIEHPYPWLLFSHGKRFKKQAFCAFSKSSGSRIHRRSIPDLHNKYVHASYHGWLVLSHQELPYFTLWNPSTLESIALPPTELKGCSECRSIRTSCILSSPPGTMKSIVMLFFRNKPNIMFCRPYFDSEWTMMQFQNKLEKDAMGDYFDFLACCNGVAYVTASRNNDKLMRIDMDVNDKLLVLVPLDIVLPPPTQARCVRYQVESLGQLFVIHIYFGGIRWEKVTSIEVYRLEFGRKQWERTDHIGDQVFFLQKNSSISCPAVSEFERGGIYFINREESLAYSYNIKERSLRVAFCTPKLQSPCQTIWVMPSLRCRLCDDQRKQENVIVEKVAPKDVDTWNDIKYSAERNLLDLSQCLLESLAKRLNFLDYMNFRAVCSEFSLAAPTIQWRKSSILESEKHHLSSWLMLFGEGREEYTMINSKLNGRYTTTIPKELTDAIIHCSKDGWLLMSTGEDSIYFFNPLTRAFVPCANLPPNVEAVSFTLTSAPTSPDYMVMFMGVYADLWLLRDNEWQLVLTVPEFVPNHNSPVWVTGMLYFLSQEGNLLYLSSEDSLDFEYLHSIPSPCNSFDQNFLVECNGILHSIFVGNLGKWVRVFEFCISEEGSLFWMEVDSLIDHTIFLSRSSTFSIEATSKEMRNRIYFPRLHKGSLVFYSLTTRKFHTADGEESFTDYKGTAEQLQCGWIEPRKSEDQCSN